MRTNVAPDDVFSQVNVNVWKLMTLWGTSSIKNKESVFKYDQEQLDILWR